MLHDSQLANYYCTTLPVNFCVVSKREQKGLIFYRLDPNQQPPPGGFQPGQLGELARIDYEPRGWGISPDGSRIAALRRDPHEGRIHIIPLGQPAPIPDVIVKGWTDLFRLSWARDGKGWFLSTAVLRATSSFLYVDGTGKATVLNAPDSFIPSWSFPSPDGRHLAIAGAPGMANPWLIENF